MVKPAELPSLRGLQALSALQNAPSLSQAAITLGLTRSALSHRIAELERQLGVTLVRQSGRCAKLTDDAHAVLAVMGDALHRIDAAIAPLRRRRRELRLSTVATFASLWLIPRLADWQTRQPDIELAIATSTRVIDFENDDVDCAIRHGLGAWPDLKTNLLFRETLVPVAAPGIPGLSPQSKLIRARSRFRDWHRWWRACDKPGEPPERGIVVETRAQAMNAALAGAGIAMMDAAYASPHIASGGLCALGAAIRLLEGYYFVTPMAPRRNTRALTQLAGWLAGQAAPCDPGAHIV